MKICRLYLIRLSVLLLPFHALAQDSTAVLDSTSLVLDTVSEMKEVKAVAKKYRYRIGIDLARAIDLSKNYMWNEMQLERINTKNGIMYLEAGAGNGSIENQYIKLQTTGVFFRYGIAQNIVYRASQDDYETANIGIRYGGAWCRNAEGQYTITDDRFGSETKVLPPRNFYRHWLELSLGMKMMIVPKWYIGWAFRTAYKMNFEDPTEISPVFIPGFGKGDSRTAVSYSIYLSFLL